MNQTIAQTQEASQLRSRHFYRAPFDRFPILAASENPMSALTIVAGTPSATIADVTATFSQTILNNNFASVATQCNNARLAISAIYDGDPLWTLAGTAAADANVTNYANGGILLTTTTTQNDQMLLTPATARQLAAGFLSQRRPHFQVTIETQASVADFRFKFALSLTSALDLATDADQVGFWFDTATSGLLYGITSIANTDVIRSTGITLAANTRYVLDITVDENRVPILRVAEGSGDLVKVCRDTTVAGSGNFGALTTAIALKPNCGIQTLANPGAKALALLDYSVGLYTA